MQPKHKREIKFHAWDEVTKTMIREHNMFHIFLNGSVSIGGVWATNDIILLQYTEEQDRHKVEIFEGDIVIVPAGYGGDNFYKEALGVIEFEGEWIVNSTNLSPIDWDELLVIGNIYEHPNMFEQSLAEAMLKAQEESVSRIWDSKEDNVWDDLYKEYK